MTTDRDLFVDPEAELPVTGATPAQKAKLEVRKLAERQFGVFSPEAARAAALIASYLEGQPKEGSAEEIELLRTDPNGGFQVFVARAAREQAEKRDKENRAMFREEWAIIVNAVNSDPNIPAADRLLTVGELQRIGKDAEDNFMAFAAERQRVRYGPAGIGVKPISGRDTVSMADWLQRAYPQLLGVARADLEQGNPSETQIHTALRQTALVRGLALKVEAEAVKDFDRAYNEQLTKLRGLLEKPGLDPEVAQELEDTYESALSQQDRQRSLHVQLDVPSGAPPQGRVDTLFANLYTYALAGTRYAGVSSANPLAVPKAIGLQITADQKAATALTQLETFHAINPDFDLEVAKGLLAKGLTPTQAVSQVRQQAGAEAATRAAGTKTRFAMAEEEQRQAIAAFERGQAAAAAQGDKESAFAIFSNAARQRFPGASRAQIGLAFDNAQGDVKAAALDLEQAEQRGEFVAGAVPPAQASPAATAAVEAERKRFADVGTEFYGSRDFDPKVAFRLMVGDSLAGVAGLPTAAAVGQARQEFRDFTSKTYDPMLAAPLEFSLAEQAQFGLKPVSLGKAIGPDRFGDLLRLDPLSPDARLAKPPTLESLRGAFAANQGEATAFANLTRVPDEPGEVATPALDLSKLTQDPAALTKILATVTAQARREQAMLAVTGPRVHPGSGGFMSTGAPAQPPPPKRTPRARLRV